MNLDSETAAWLARHDLTLPAREDLVAVAERHAAEVEALFAPASCGHDRPQCPACPWVVFADRSQWTVARLRDLFGVQRVPEPTGVEASGAPFFSQSVADGRVAVFQRRTDDCLQAALATVMGINPWQIPDLRICERLASGADTEEVAAASEATTAEWCADNGLRLRRRDREDHGADLWVGVVNSHGAAYRSHCLVLAGEDVVFDPAWRLPDGGPERFKAAIAPGWRALALDTYRSIDYRLDIERTG